MNRPLAIVALLLLAGALPVVWPMPSLAAVLLTAPSLLLLPTGLGLASLYGLTGRRPAELTALQALLLAYFVGLFLFILFFVASERFLVEPPRPGVLMAGLWLAALAGWLRMRSLLAVPREAVQPLLLVVALAGLLVALRYGSAISIYSDYPVMDLFQRIQFHGGAFEFARTLTLNPFVASSYIPFQQLELGLVLRLTGADPLDAEWVWPLAMAPLQAGVLYAFFSRILPQRRAAIVAFALVLAQSAFSNPTNGGIAELAAITLLSLLLTGDPRAGGPRKAALLRLPALAVGVVMGLALLKMPLEGAGLAAVVMVLLGGILISGCRHGLLAAIVLLAAVALPFHRGALLYVVLGGASVGAYWCLLYLQEVGGKKVRRLLRGLFLAVVAIAAAMAARILLLPESQTDAFGLWRLFDLILVPLAGKSLSAVAVDGDLAPGAGSRVALFELARMASPLIVGATTAYMVLLSLPAFRRRWGFLDKGAERQTLAQMLVVFGLVMLILTGFPFIHRVGFLVTLLASAALANVFLSTRLGADGSRPFALLLAFYAVAVVVAVYLGAPDGVQPYLGRALPVFAALGVLLAAVPFLRWGNPAHGGWRTAVVLVLAVTAEVATSNAYFKSYAFQRQTPPSSGALASFDESDLALARFVADHADGTEVLISSPKTMTFLRARTGLSPFLVSSNLDTIDVSAREKLAGLLGAMVSDRPDPQVCGKLMAMLEAGESGIYSYAVARRWVPRESGKAVLDAFGYDNRLVPSYDAQLATALKVAIGQRFLIIIDRTTVDWLGDPEELRYFPVHGPLPSTVVTNLDRNFPVHHVYQDSYIAELECK